MIHKLILEPTKGGVIVTTDIHGCLPALEDLLAKLSFSAADTLIIAGDAIDRGPDSVGVLDFIEANHNVHCIKGNHEWLAINAIDNHQHGLWHANGGGWAMDDVNLKKHIDQMRAFPDIIEVRTSDGVYGIIHAEPDTNIWGDMGTVDPKKIVWGRSRLRGLEPPTFVRGIKEIFCGHTIVEHPTYTGNVFHMDKGAFLGNDLHYVTI
jgi:serine/threonine protein phosphatase 1